MRCDVFIAIVVSRERFFVGICPWSLDVFIVVVTV